MNVKYVLTVVSVNEIDGDENLEKILEIFHKQGHTQDDLDLLKNSKTLQIEDYAFDKVAKIRTTIYLSTAKHD